jgi:hypothetical protein
MAEPIPDEPLVQLPRFKRLVHTGAGTEILKIEIGAYGGVAVAELGPPENDKHADADSAVDQMKKFMRTQATGRRRVVRHADAALGQLPTTTKSAHVKQAKSADS